MSLRASEIVGVFEKKVLHVLIECLDLGIIYWAIGLRTDRIIGLFETKSITLL